MMLVGIINLIIIKYNGKSVPVPQIPRNAETYGTGMPLTYVVLGDSTAVGQGGDYDSGIARSTARILARDYRVTFQNFGVSGAVAADVANKQAAQAAKLKPDAVLIAVTANDVTRLTRLADIEKSLESTLVTLRRANPDVQVILTGAPAMGTIPRFPQPARYFAAKRTEKINAMVENLSEREKVIFAPIAAETGPTFARNPTLFAQDKFHPTTAGYQVWIPTLERTLQKL